MTDEAEERRREAAEIKVLFSILKKGRNFMLSQAAEEEMKMGLWERVEKKRVREAKAFNGES